MNSLNELISFIENNFPKDNGDESNSLTDWKDFITNKFPNWENIIKDNKNWNKIIKSNILIKKSEITYLFFEKIGIDFVILCYDSNKYKEKIFTWIIDNISDLNKTLWNKLTEDFKRRIINKVYSKEKDIDSYSDIFKHHIRSVDFYLHDLHDLIRNNNTMINRINRIHRELFHIPFFQKLPIFYIPSKELLTLLSIAKECNDKKSKEIIEDLINENKKYFYEFNIQNTTKSDYRPTMNEINLISMAINIFIKEGYNIINLPKIELSLDTPPFFILHPEIYEDFYNFPLKEGEMEKDIKIPEFINIEELLGCYIPDKYNSKIVLYQKGMEWVSERSNIDEELLRAIVLVHEIGHWITHLLPHSYSKFWDINNYNLTDTEVHEGWAQLITYWVVNEAGTEFQKVFDDLNKHQSSPYKVYKKFINNSEEDMVRSLLCLRKNNAPVNLKKWEEILNI